MNFSQVILRKICDDPQTRNKAYQLLINGHFQNKIERYLFKSIKEFHNLVITSDQLIDFISTKNLKDKIHGQVCEVIGSIFEGKTPLESDFEYAVKAIASEAETTVMCLGLQRAATELSRGNLIDAKRLLEESSAISSSFRIVSDRRKTAREMSSLRSRKNEECFRTGFRKFDEITGGGRRGELWLWAAYTGEMKSSSMLAIAHNLFLQKKNVLFISLEMMTEEEVKPRLLCQHAAHLGTLLPYKEIETHDFSKGNDRVYKRVVEDFDHNESYGDIQIFQPPLGCTILDIAREIELCSSKVPYEVVILDYIQKLSATDKNKEHRVEMAKTLDDAKKIAMESLSRHGVFLLSGYQVSSDGRKNAETNGEKYNLWCLSETIAAAQVPNVICWSLITDAMRRNKEMKVGLMKSRNSPIEGSIHFLPVDLSVGFIGKDAIIHNDALDVAALDLVGE